MKSASQMSLEIRAKKKAMQADPNVVDLSGVSMDKTDEDIMQANEMTSDLGLDTNKPMTHHMDLMADSHDRKAELEAPMSDETHMMAEGGKVEDDDMKDMDKTHETTIRPDGGFGKVTLIEAKGGEIAMKRKARLAKKMSR